MSRKLTVDVEVIDPRNGDNFGYKVYNDGVPLIFTQSGYPDSNGWNKTYVTGTVSQIIQCNRFLKLNSDLEVQVSNVNITNGKVNDLVYINDENIIIAGEFTNFNGTSCNNVIKTDLSGLTFSTFENGFNSAVFTLKRNTTPTSQSPLGTMLFGGDFMNYKTTPINRLLRTDINGSQNNGFISQIMSGATLKGFNNRVNDVDEQSNGRVVVVGDFTNFNGVARNKICRLNSNGSNDSGFTIGTGFGGGVNCVRCLGTSIYVGGSFATYNSVLKPYIIKLNDNGSPDATFTPDASLNGSVLAIEFNSSDQVFIGGNFNKGLHKLNSDGSINLTFSVNIGTGFTKTGGGMKVNAVAIDASGNIFVGGDFDNFNGEPCLNFVKLNFNGELVAKLDLNYQISSSDVVKVIRLSGSNVYVGGSFTNYRLENDISTTGDLYNIPLPEDITFNFGTAFNGTVYKATIYNDEIICFGNFTTYKTTNICNSVAKLTLDGDFIDGFTGTTEAISYNAIVLSDGSFIIAGVDNADGIDVSALGYIIKFNNDLTQDVSFNSAQDGFSYKPYKPFTVKKNDDSNIIFGLSGYDGDYNGNSIDFFNGYDGRLIIINSNGDYISREQIGRYWVSLYYNNSEDRIIFNSVENPFTRFEIYNTSFVLETSLNDTFRSVELSNGNIVVKGSFSNGTSYFNEYGVYSYSFGIISPDGLTSIKENSGVGLNNNSLPNNNIWTDSEFIYVYNNSTGITYNGISVNKLFRLNQDLEIDMSFNYSGNMLIKDILFKSNYILLLGDDIEVINYNGDIINSIGDIENAVQNTYDNLVEFNSGAGITYSIIDNVVRMEYEFEDDEIVIEDVFDVPYHVELDVTNESLTITDLVTEIYTRSPELVYSSDDDFIKTDYRIRVWEGSLFDAASQSFIYDKTKIRLTYDQYQVYTDISKISGENLRSNIYQIFDTNVTTSNALDSNMSKWVNVERVNHGTSSIIATYSTNYYAMDGYLYNYEHQGALPNILTLGNIRMVERNDKIRLYYLANRLNNINVKIYNDLELLEEFDITPQVDVFLNTLYVQSLRVANSYLSNSNRLVYELQYEDNTEIFVYEIFDECLYVSNQLLFKNKFGVFDSINVSKSKTDTINVKGEEYIKSIVDINGNYDVAYHSNRMYNVTGKVKSILNTPIYPDYMTEVMTDLYMSEEVFLVNEFNNVIPVVITNRDLLLKGGIQSQTQYEIEVEQSHNIIKNFK